MLSPRLPLSSFRDHNSFDHRVPLLFPGVKATGAEAHSPVSPCRRNVRQVVTSRKQQAAASLCMIVASWCMWQCIYLVHCLTLLTAIAARRLRQHACQPLPQVRSRAAVAQHPGVVVVREASRSKLHPSRCCCSVLPDLGEPGRPIFSGNSTLTEVQRRPPAKPRPTLPQPDIGINQ